MQLVPDDAFDAIRLAESVLWLIDREGRYLEIVGDSLALLGRSPADLIGTLRHDPHACGEEMYRNRQTAVDLPDGAKAWVSSSGEPVRDVDGAIVGFRGLDFGITALRESQDLLDDVSRTMALAQKATQVGKWDWRVGEDFSIWDNQMAELYQVKREDPKMPFAVWRSMLHPEDRDRIERELEVHLGKADRFSLRFRIVRPDEKVRHMHSEAIIQRDDSGAPVRVVGIERDESREILLRRSLLTAKERAEAANLAKSEFLALMSHEIRTPMNAVLGFCELLEGTPLSGEQTEFLSAIRSGGQSLLQIIDSLLEYSRLEAGRFDVAREPVNLAGLLEETFRLLSPLAASKQLEYRIELAPGLPSLISSDSFALKRIVTNLLGNAIKFTQAGSVVLRGVPAPDSSEVDLRIEVEDTGVGLDESTLPRIFEPFSQGDSIYSRKQSGTGLGLAVAQRMAHALGGKLSAHPQPAGGSRFVFEFPALAHTEAAATPDHKQAPPAPRALGLKVLVVEDNPANQKLAELFLKRLGCSCITAPGGSEALEALQSAHFDVVLMDIQMPGMDGWETTRRIRAVEAQSKAPALPIYAITAHAGDEDFQHCLDVGMNGRLVKPFTLDAFAKLLGLLASDSAGRSAS